MSNFNYCPLTWHFCGEVETKKLEKIQERALRFIYEDHVSSYETLLHKSKMPSLKLRRMRTLALETFRIIHKETPVYLHDIINVKHNSYSFRYSNLVEIPQVRTTFYGKNSFRFGAAIMVLYCRHHSQVVHVPVWSSQNTRGPLKRGNS